MVDKTPILTDEELYAKWEELWAAVGIAIEMEKDEVLVLREFATYYIEKGRQMERERITNMLQDLLEMSGKNKEPTIKVRMMDVLQALKEGKDV